MIESSHNWFEIPPPPSESVNPPVEPDPALVMGPTLPPEGDAALNRTEPLPAVPADAATTQPSEPEKIKLREKVGTYLGIAYHGLRATVKEKRQEWAEDAELVSEDDEKFYSSLGRVVIAHMKGNDFVKLDSKNLTSDQKKVTDAVAAEIKRIKHLNYLRYQQGRKATSEINARTGAKTRPGDILTGLRDTKPRSESRIGRAWNNLTDPSKPRVSTRRQQRGLDKRANFLNALPEAIKTKSKIANQNAQKASKRADTLYEAAQAHRERQEELKQKLKK